MQSFLHIQGGIVDMHNFSKQPTQDISFDSLKTADRLIIKTENNQYWFKVTDPTNRSGILSGGRLGDKEYEAIFLFTAEGSPEMINEQTIRTSARAVFLLNRGQDPMHLRTSSITNIKLLREANSMDDTIRVLAMPKGVNDRGH